MAVTRFLSQYFRPTASAIEVLSATYSRDGVTLPARVHRPRGTTKPLPCWIVLHGLTYHGVNHPSLIRFANSLAASGHVVFVPEITEWTRLLVAPSLTTPTIRASLAALSNRTDVDAMRIGVFGFSFGATQGLVAAGEADIAEKVRAITAWGGYGDLERVVHFGQTGEHEFDGIHEQMEPDPYGRWIFAGNWLTDVPGYEDMGNVANALLELARAAGKSGRYAGDVAHNPMKRKIGETLTPREREVYELFAPASEIYDTPAARALGKKLAVAIALKEPVMNPHDHFERVRIPVILAHGRDDRLVPYTETLRIRRRVPQHMLKNCTITSLFSHSGGSPLMRHPVRLAREVTSFVSVLRQIVTVL